MYNKQIVTFKRKNGNMVKLKKNSKFINGELFYTANYLKEQLLLTSDRQARNILSNYEHVQGKSPRLYEQSVIEKAISDWKSKPSNRKKLNERKKEWEKLRADSEKKFYEKFEQNYNSIGNNQSIPSGLKAKAHDRFDNELQLMMLKNLYSALGISFDYEKFFTDLEIDNEYRWRLGTGALSFGNERPVEVIEAQERLLSDNAYLIKK